MARTQSYQRAAQRKGILIALAAFVTALFAMAICAVVMLTAATGATPFGIQWPFGQATDRVAEPAKTGEPTGLRPSPVLPPSDPAALRPLSKADAIGANAALPIAVTPNPAAARFLLADGDIGSWARALDCLTAAAYYEAATEGPDGMRAVAQVVLNRMRHPAFPHSICGVVFEGAQRRTGCQFTFTCDGSLARSPSRTGWIQARTIAAAALGGYIYAPVGWSTHYHADYVMPYWAPSLVKTAIVGRHIFYRWNGGWGLRTAFTAQHAGIEPMRDIVPVESALSATPSNPATMEPTAGGKALVTMEDRPALPAHIQAGEPKAITRPLMNIDNRRVLGGVE